MYVCIHIISGQKIQHLPDFAHFRSTTGMQTILLVEQKQIMTPLYTSIGHKWLLWGGRKGIQILLKASEGLRQALQ